MREQPLPILNRLACIPSQILLVKYKNHSLQITLDTGATVSYIRRSKAVELGLQILPNDQLALLADQCTKMVSQGEVDFLVSLGNTRL